MGFLYFRPGESQRVPAELAYAFDQPPITHQVIANGPDGSGGIIFAGGRYHEGPNRVGVYHDQQTWQRMPGGNLWVGWYRDEVIGPDELARPAMLPGRAVTLGDGKQWTVPIAIAFVEAADGTLRRQTVLPCKLALADDGNWTVGDVVQKYQRLFEVARSWWDGEEGTTIADATNWCCTALAANYRVSAIEASILGLFETNTYADVLNVLIDLETLKRRQAEKKSEPPVTLNTSPGSVDSTRSTDQPLLTS